MNNNYFILQLLVSRLQSILIGMKMMAAFSQNKEEIILQFAGSDASFTIRANLRGDFSGLSFPNDFARKGKNSVDLFQGFQGLTIAGIEMIPFDRSFFIQFENDKLLLFKMHGRRSNLIGLENGEVITIFKNSMAADNEISMENLAGNIDLEAASRSEDVFSLKKAVPVLENSLAKQILDENWLAGSLPERRKAMEDFLHAMENKKEFYIEEINDKIALSFWPQTESNQKFTDVLAALNYFNQKTMSIGGLKQQKKSLLGEIQK